MNPNILQSIMQFFFKYIWLFCTCLIFLEVSSTIYSANLLMQQSSRGVMQSVSGEVSGRIDGVLRLLKGLAADQRFADTTTDLADRATFARPYKESYNLFMIALTDKDVNVVSTNTKPNAPRSNLAARDYMKRLYATGIYQITDAFPAGADGATLNYTIAVPITKNGVVEGTVFGSIYFDDIVRIISRDSYNQHGQQFYLLGGQNTIMATRDAALQQQNFLDRADIHYLFTDKQKISQDFISNTPGSYWQWSREGLSYILYQQVAPTNWMLVYQINFASIFYMLLPTLLLKSLLYVLLCGLVVAFGKRYLDKRLAALKQLLNKMALMQKKLFQTEQSNYDNLLEISEQGLLDHLTGLATRTVLSDKLKTIVYETNIRGAFIFIDVDNLKYINDNFGHKAGDYALVHAATVFKKYAQAYNGFAARYGGDEFILILEEIESGNTIESIGENLCSDLRSTWQIGDQTISTHGSIGIALYPDAGITAEELISKADLALYRAKQNGKDQFVIYQPHMS